MRHAYVANAAESLLLIIDFQEALIKVMDSWESIAQRVIQLIRAADVLGVPVLLTEQYKIGLGETLPDLRREIKSPVVFEKEHFSACLETNFLPTVRSFDRSEIIVVGMEAHVCVLQTCLDLIIAGFKVHLVADAVISRARENRDIAVDLLRQAGAVISATEIVIFQWARRANTDAFRRILPIVK